MGIEASVGECCAIQLIAVGNVVHDTGVEVLQVVTEPSVQRLLPMDLNIDPPDVCASAYCTTCAIWDGPK